MQSKKEEKKDSPNKKISITAKFGGSSLSNAKRILNVKDIILADSNRKFIVVSAPGKDDSHTIKVTDSLYALSDLVSKKLFWESAWKTIASRFYSLISELGLERELKNLLEEVEDSIKNNLYTDFIVSRGEYLSARIMAEVLKKNNPYARFIDSRELIFFNSSGALDYARTCRAIRKKCNAKGMFVIPGFYGTMKNKIKIFSRGGSDITGALVACALHTFYENWTDVSGFYTADPRKVPEARPIKQMTYREARALSYAGAAVLHEETAMHLVKEGISMAIRNTNKPDHPGTLIKSSNEGKKNSFIGIAGKQGFIIFTVDKMMMNESIGQGRKLLGIFEAAKIPYDHEATGIDTISIFIDGAKSGFSDSNKLLKKILSEIKDKLSPDQVTVVPNVGIIVVVSQFGNNRDIFIRVSKAMSQKNIKILLLSMEPSGQIIIAVPDKNFPDALRAVHSALF